MMDGRGKSDSSVVPEEAAEQGRGTGGGGGGGKGAGQGELARAQRAPDTGPGRRAQRARAGTSGSNEGQEAAVHRAPAPRLRRRTSAGRPTSASKRNAAAGVDGETWQHYGEDLEANLQDLSERLKRGAYRAKPVRRAYIPKADGRQRPLGVPALEDKIVQRAVVEVLNAIYEADFLGFSYGFRPGRSPHQALDALAVGIRTKKVNWVLDADIRAFFDTLDHGWLVKFVEHRVADRRVVRLIQKWLNAGVLEEGKRTQE